MPKCGSQIVLCDLPVRFDTYEGCSHACRYCFASRKSNIANIKNGESADALKRFIAGGRTKETEVFDWNIPLHWGSMSDPFQPIERERGKSLAALRVFADTGYPFAVSTKSALIAEPKYIELLKQCNAVVQFSACSPQFNAIEQGASSFEDRLRAAEQIAKFTRVNIRIQPYIPAIFRDVLKMIPRLAQIGVYGIILEGMKYTVARREGLVRVAGDLCYPVNILLPQFKAIKNACHKAGLKFYAGENRLRIMGDDLCCCGVEGLGWKVNTGNLNHLLFAKGTEVFSPKMNEPGTCSVFGAMHQTTLFSTLSANRTYREQMIEEAKTPLAYMEGGGNFPKPIAEKIRLRLRDYLKAARLKAKDIDRHLGTAGMAGHYFGASQWSLPTEPAYEKMREIMPMPPLDDFLAECGALQYKPLYKLITKI